MKEIDTTLDYTCLITNPHPSAIRLNGLHTLTPSLFAFACTVVSRVDPASAILILQDLHISEVWSIAFLASQRA